MMEVVGKGLLWRFPLPSLAYPVVGQLDIPLGKRGEGAGRLGGTRAEPGFPVCEREGISRAVGVTQSGLHCLMLSVSTCDNRI